MRARGAGSARTPEIDTVFVTSNADTPVGASAGKTMDEVKIDGFRRAWRALPRTVRHLVVLRDLTKSTPQTFECVLAASSAATQRLAPLCPLPRAQVQQKDLGVQTGPAPARQALCGDRHDALRVRSPATATPSSGASWSTAISGGTCNRRSCARSGPTCCARSAGCEASWTEAGPRPTRARRSTVRPVAPGRIAVIASPRRHQMAPLVALSSALIALPASPGVHAARAASVQVLQPVRARPRPAGRQADVQPHAQARRQRVVRDGQEGRQVAFTPAAPGCR